MEDIRRLITFSREVKGTGRISGYADASMKRREMPPCLQALQPSYRDLGVGPGKKRGHTRNFAIFEPTGTPSSSATGRHFAARR